MAAGDLGQRADRGWGLSQERGERAERPSPEAGISKTSVLDIYGIVVSAEAERMVCMATKTPIEIDQEALAVAAEVLGTTTKKDTVNAALREVGQRLVRLRALARLGEMADRGDFDEFLDGKAAYRR
jgi:Arc/MetJ family transcription regulator